MGTFKPFNPEQDNLDISATDVNKVIDETGWLIEYNYKNAQTSWIAVGPDDKTLGCLMLTHVHDASKALRFARQQDAQAVLDMYIGPGAPDWYKNLYTITQHTWPVS